MPAGLETSSRSGKYTASSKTGQQLQDQVGRAEVRELLPLWPQIQE